MNRTAHIRQREKMNGQTDYHRDNLTNVWINRHAGRYTDRQTDR